MPGEHDLYTIHPSSSLGRRLLIGILLLVFVGLIGATAWILIRGHEDAIQSAANDGTGNNAAAAPTSDSPLIAQTGQPAAEAVPTEMNARITDLEQRLTHVSVAAQTASGYANRAEAIMIAFAARRAIDAGEPLDYLADQMRLLFESAQPRAVNTIINAARDPVTVNKLRAGLDDIDVIMEKGDPREGWWSATMRTLGSLVVVRRQGAPSPEPEQRLARARRAVEAGQIEDAIKEMAALPSQAAVMQWLDQARRYNEAHRALDIIEAAAILEPRATAVVLPPTAPVADSSAAPPPAATPGSQALAADFAPRASNDGPVKRIRSGRSRFFGDTRPYGANLDRHRHEGSHGMGCCPSARRHRARPGMRLGDSLTAILVRNGLDVFAVDAAPSLVSAFQRNLPDVPVACESVEHSRFFGRKFDAILAWGLMFLLPPTEQRRLIARIATIPTPGGRLLFTAPAEPAAWNDVMTRRESWSLGAVEYRALLVAAGFRPLRDYEGEGQNHHFEAMRPAESTGRE